MLLLDCHDFGFVFDKMDLEERELHLIIGVIGEILRQDADDDEKCSEKLLPRLLFLTLLVWNIVVISVLLNDT